ncbi:DUF1345 domain-containing protein [Paracoccus sp. (in: a-proteobacteria)]|jgi:uncharacterized membrane protein|uniref:DUF1345 domain-containing protein n=1 Tax=Paracoccus sp. TaxID=267 RepID=UPI0035B160C6
MWHDLLRHGRFLVSFAFGLALGLAAFRMQTIDRVLVFSVSFNLCFLILSALALRRSDAESLRARADENDEGMKVIVPLAGGAVLTSLVAILLTIQDPHSGATLRPLMALISVPLGWLMVHSMMAFHYASLWYAPDQDGQPGRGLGFPGLAEGQDAQLWDFIYYSFTIGLASQTADVSALTTRMRRITLLHSVFAFYYNTVVLALAVNAAASLG